MVETAAKKQKIGTISEDDVCSLLQRYPATAILSLLREVAQYPEVDIDWDILLKKTTTGIQSARELQVLWRHLAYRHPLIDDKIPDTALALDDDSDLEYEVETFPPVSTEGAMEAATCVKVLASGSANESAMPNNANVESDMPNSHASKFTSDNPPGASLLPSSNMALAQNEVDANNLRKKRKWSEEEDLKLVTGVQKWGEGNWAAIIKEVHWGRTPGQLAQRWSNLRKKQGSMNAGAASSTGQLSEAQLATRRAINMALKDNLATGNGAAGPSSPAKPKASNVETPATTIVVPAQKQLSQPTNTTLKAAPKARPKKAPPKPPSVSDTIQRTAVAAGARIVNPLNTSLCNFTNVHFIRTAKSNIVNTPPPAVAVSQLPKAKTTPILCSSGSANDGLQKQEGKTSAETNVPCSETKPIVKVRENESSLPRFLPKAAPVPGRSRLTSVGATTGLIKQTAAAGNTQRAALKGNNANEGKDGTLRQVVRNPVPVDVSENMPAIQGICTPSVDGRHESACSIVDGGTEKMEGSSEGLVETK